MARLQASPHAVAGRVLLLRQLDSRGGSARVRAEYGSCQWWVEVSGRYLDDDELGIDAGGAERVAMTTYSKTKAMEQV